MKPKNQGKTSLDKKSKAGITIMDVKEVTPERIEKEAFKKPKGCGKDFRVKSNYHLYECGERGKLCPECPKPKNHSPQVDKDKPSVENTNEVIAGGTFNLSKLYFNWNKGDVIPRDNVYFLSEDIKKFIKLLKKELNHIEFSVDARVLSIIDKLAGDDLI